MHVGVLPQSRVSRARNTSPMPPAPSGPATSKCPRWVPAAKVIVADCAIRTEAGKRRATFDAITGGSSDPVSGLSARPRSRPTRRVLQRADRPGPSQRLSAPRIEARHEPPLRESYAGRGGSDGSIPRRRTNLASNAGCSVPFLVPLLTELLPARGIRRACALRDRRDPRRSCRNASSPRTCRGRALLEAQRATLRPRATLVPASSSHETPGKSRSAKSRINSAWPSFASQETGSALAP